MRLISWTLRSGSKQYFFCRFLQSCAQVLRPLTNLLKGDAQNIGVDHLGTEDFPK